MEVGAQREVQRMTEGSRELTWSSRHNRGVGMLFQTVKVITAIFRARVRRAISGLIPFATRAS